MRQLSCPDNGRPVLFSGWSGHRHWAGLFCLVWLLAGCELEQPAVTAGQPVKPAPIASPLHEASPDTAPAPAVTPAVTPAITQAAPPIEPAPIQPEPGQPEPGQPAPGQPAPAIDQDPPDMVGNLIANLDIPQPQADSDQLLRDPDLLLAPMQPAVPESDEAAGPPDPDSPDNELAEQALQAALSLLAEKSPPLPLETEFELPAKPAGNTRVGLLLPFSGQWAGLGSQIAAGAELALFQSGKQGLELVYLDTAGGSRAALAANEAVKAQTDILIGPLFTASAEAIDATGLSARLPALSLSNNQQIARPGRWVMGYLPEQQIDMLLGHAIALGKSRIAILSGTDAFGAKLRDHGLRRLRELGMDVADLRLLDAAILQDEEALSQTVREFARYVPPAEGQLELPPPPFDAILLTGSADFVLRTAPVLAYYDLGPDRVLYLGTDLWARDGLRDEPSLQGSLITLPDLPDDARLQKIWLNNFSEQAETLAKTGFDAMAMITAFSDQNSQPDTPASWSRKLTREKGFNGFSGPFRLLPDGVNQRRYALHRLTDGQPVALEAGR